jgi:hypothetical protein
MGDETWEEKGLGSIRDQLNWPGTGEQVIKPAWIQDNAWETKDGNTSVG